MSKLIIDFKRDEDIMVPAPWPVGIDATYKVTSGLGNDDGAVLIGLAHPGVEGLTYMPGDIGDIDFEVEELVPVFSNQGGFFIWNFIIRGVREIEEVTPVTDMHFTLDIQLSNDSMQVGEDIARALRFIADQLDNDTYYGEWDALTPAGQDFVTGNFVRDRNGNKVGTWDIKEVAR